MIGLVEAAVGGFLNQFPTNDWFLNTYWPENLPRVRLMATDALELYPNPSAREILDVGCGYGHCSLLFAKLGFRVTATDATIDPGRDDLFQKHGMRFFTSNLNATPLLPEVEEGAYDLVLLGEVIEHILNHPLGLLQRLAVALKPGGWLMLTTPNPSTLMNAVRVLFDRHTLWGTQDFGQCPKIVDREVICKGDIHYREYRTSELKDLLKLAGLRPTMVRYLGSEPARTQTWAKQCLLRSAFGRWLGRTRPFGSGQYLLATRDP